MANAIRIKPNWARPLWVALALEGWISVLVCVIAIAATAEPNALDHPARFAPSVAMPLTGKPQTANFLEEPVSDTARRVANWVVASDDNKDLPFLVVDKVAAKVFVFDSEGRLRGATLALLGKAYGDDTVAGIGGRKLSAIRPEERTTPAGRFVAMLGRDLKQDILWIDYGNALSLHRVIFGAPSDHRLQRLATPSALDKRITYGCINVPVLFFEDIVLKTFTGTKGIVYILPETKPIEDVFPGVIEMKSQKVSGAVLN